MGLSIVSDVCVQRGWSLEIGESSEGGARFEITNSPMVLEPIADDRSDVHADRALELTDEIEVGTLQTEGKAEYDPITDRWSVSADGTNIWRHWNDFYFVHTPVDGPVSIRGRVTDIEEVDAFSKAGFMIRDELEDASTYGFVGATPGFGTEVLWRTQRGEDGTSQQLRGVSIGVVPRRPPGRVRDVFRLPGRPGVDSDRSTSDRADDTDPRRAGRL